MPQTMLVTRLTAAVLCLLLLLVNLESTACANVARPFGTGHHHSELNTKDWTRTLTSWTLYNAENRTDGPYNVTTPTTVLAALEDVGIYHSLYRDRNLASVDSDRFHFWPFSTAVKDLQDAKRVVLLFHGLNYRANVTVNGHTVADSTKLVGTFRRFAVDVTSEALHEDKKSKDSLDVAVTVQRPQDRALPPGNNDTDLAISFVDWAPSPPDGNMGLWLPVDLVGLQQDVNLLTAFVSLKNSTLPMASLELVATVENFSESPENVTVSWTIPSIDVKESKAASVPGKGVGVVSTAIQVPSAGLPLWWPWTHGNATMLDMTVELQQQSAGETTSSTSTPQERHFRVGLREMTSSIINDTRTYFVNGMPMFIRGGGYSPDLLLRFNHTVMRRHFLQATHAGLNTFRLEGKMMPEEFYTIADEMGFLIMPGWCCCDAWQHWDVWGPVQLEVATASLATQIQIMARHPSVFVFLYGSDEAPPKHVETAYLSVFQREHWPNPILAAASNRTSTIGPTGVKMNGPYAWVPPVYWEQARSPDALPTDMSGGAFGFSTETCPGASPPDVVSYRSFLSKQYLWPMNEVWDYHCGSEEGLFGSLKFFLPPLQGRLGTPECLESFVARSHYMTYEGQRAMFEAFSRFVMTSRASSGLIQWMYNSPFPNMMWHLVGHDDRVSAGYYGAKKAMAPLSVTFMPWSRTVTVVNDRVIDPSFSPQTLSLQLFLFDLTGQELDSKEYHVDWPLASRAVQVANISEMLDNACKVDPKTVNLLRLQLELPKGQSQAEQARSTFVNDYYIPCQRDELDWKNTTFYITYCRQFADLSPIMSMPNVSADSLRATVQHQAPGSVAVTIENRSSNIAPLCHLELACHGSAPLSFVVWSDNFVTLLPSESRKLVAFYIDGSSQQGTFPCNVADISVVITPLADTCAPPHDV